MRKILKRGYTITEKRKQILKFIIRFVSDNGYPPTFREIGEAVELYSLATVHAHLYKLEESGHIRIEHGKPRAIKVLKTA